MSFEVILQGDPAQTDRLPTRAAVDQAFAGYIIGSSPTWPGRIQIGQGDDWCELFLDPEAAVIAHLMVSRPVASPWLWDRLYGLMADYDLLMYWPGDHLIAAMTRADVPHPFDIPVQREIVGSPAELLDLIQRS